MVKTGGNMARHMARSVQRQNEKRCHLVERKKQYFSSKKHSDGMKRRDACETCGDRIV